MAQQTCRENSFTSSTNATQSPGALKEC